MKQKRNKHIAAILVLIGATATVLSMYLNSQQQPVKQQENKIKPVQVDTETAGDSSPVQIILIP